jgi:hypothetical protein
MMKRRQQKDGGAKMKTKMLASVMTIAIVIIAFLVWIYWTEINYSGKTKHETNAWAVIKDSKGDVISVETTSSVVWDNLVGLHDNQTEMWIGGIVEEYDNYWGFRFRPDTIVVAQITIEGAQSNIQGISGDLNYWISVWTKEAYVLSNVVETHQ